MIKIVFFLSLIYFISCNSNCNDKFGDNSPTKVKDCTSVKADENKKCCYYEYKCPDYYNTVRECSQLGVNVDIKQEIDNEYLYGKEPCDQSELKINIICNDEDEDEEERNNSCYLKIGMLLILGLLF